MEFRIATLLANDKDKDLMELNLPYFTYNYKVNIKNTFKYMECVCEAISELVYNMNELLSTSQAVSHPRQAIDKVRKVAFFYLFQLNIYFCISARFSRVGLNTNIKKVFALCFNLTLSFSDSLSKPFCFL